DRGGRRRIALCTHPDGSAGIFAQRGDQSVATGQEAGAMTMETPRMKLVEEVTDGVTVVEAYGRLDSTTAKEFGDRLSALVQAGRAQIVLDLKNIAYISSAGFRVLLLANRATAEKQGKLALCGVLGEVKRLFEIGSFLDQFLICQTQADGVGKLRQCSDGGIGWTRPHDRSSDAPCRRGGQGRRAAAHLVQGAGPDPGQGAGARLAAPAAARRAHDQKEAGRAGPWGRRRPAAGRDFLPRDPACRPDPHP